MSEQQQAMNRERWPLLESVNMIEMLSYLGTSPLAERQITDEIEWVITGVWDNTFNGVVRAQISEAHVDQVIDEVASRFRERDVPHLWFLNVDSRPNSLEQLLLAHGWVRLREGVGMAIGLSAIAEPFPPPQDLTIERVVDEEGVTLWGTFHRYLENDQRDERENGSTSVLVWMEISPCVTTLPGWVESLREHSRSFSGKRQRASTTSRSQIIGSVVGWERP